MTTTTGDPSSLKTPASLSGGDLVSRLLAATPPYLYNVPLTPHSFFFSEMLRSFVQAKTETSSLPVASPSLGRRRKRSWKDTRERPLELTTKEKNHQLNTNHEKYFADLNENRYKDTFEGPKDSNFEDKSFGTDVLKPLDENRPDCAKHSRHFFDDTRHLSSASVNQAELERKDYEERMKKGSEVNFITETNAKMDFSAKNILSSVPTRLEEQKNSFGMPNHNSLPTNPEFIPNPLWYPPYPMHQSYPGIDPLHFFIDLRVSGHIWDRKVNERSLPFKSKHCSAFSVPQSKEFNNRPLNLTRDEGNSKDDNSRGTNFILKNLTRTYKGIERTMQNETREDEEESKDEDSEKCGEGDDNKGESSKEGGKDLRAVIGLELVVDYVKQPKEEPAQSPQTE